MGDLASYDDVVDAVTKLVDDWSSAIKDAAKKLADVKDEMDKLEALKKQRQAAADDAQKASQDLANKIMSLKVSPKADPDPFKNLPGLVKKIVTKGGVPLGNTGVTLAPWNVKVDPPPKFKIDSAGLKLKIDF